MLCQTGIQNYIKIKNKTVSSLHQVDGSWRTFLTDSFICIGHDWSWSIGFHPAGSRLAPKLMYRNRFFMVTRWHDGQYQPVLIRELCAQGPPPSQQNSDITFSCMDIDRSYNRTWPHNRTFEFNLSRARRVNSSSGAWRKFFCSESSICIKCAASFLKKKVLLAACMNQQSQ